MKKSVLLCIAVWFLLIASLIVIYDFAQGVEPVMEAPEWVGIDIKDDVVVLEWQPVEYATSYSIHRRSDKSESWELVKAVGTTTTQFIVEDAVPGDEYSVRSCNYSLGTYHWSNFSKAMKIV